MGWYPYCCSNCIICGDRRVPSEIDLTFSGWADAYANNSDLCPAGTGTTLISTLSALNTTITLVFSRELSTPGDECCAVFVGAMEYGDYIFRADGTFPDENYACDPPFGPDQVPIFEEEAWARGNSICFILLVGKNEDGDCVIKLYTSKIAPEDLSPAVGCEMSPADAQLQFSTTVEDECAWFCEGGNTGNMFDAMGFDTNLIAYPTFSETAPDNGGILYLFIQSAISPASSTGPTSMTLEASSERSSV